MAEPASPPRLRIPLQLSVPRHLAGAGWTVVSSSPTRRTVELFDTGDRRLAAAGAELSFSRHDGWCWRRGGLGNPKLPTREWSAPAAVPAALLDDWSRAYRRGRPLGSRASICVHRRSHRVSRAPSIPGFTLVEERLDEQGASGWTPRLRRVTVSDADGHAAVRELLADVVIDDDATLAVLRPSLVRAPRLRLPDAGAVGPRDLFVRSATMSVTQWLYFDGELLGASSPDALRKVRVALRRLRSDLQTFAPVLDREWAAQLRARLGELATRLGTVRDAEVLAGRVGELAAQLAGADREDAALLAAVAASELAAARAQLLEELAGRAYLELLDNTVTAVARPRWSEDVEIASVIGLAAKPWRRLRRFVASLGDAADDEQLHRVRILAKRVRYAADACVPVAGAPAAASAAAVADLQTVLGEQHDAVVTRQWLRDHSATSAGVAFAAGEMAAIELGRLRGAAQRWRDAWTAASRRKEWRWLRS